MQAISFAQHDVCVLYPHHAVQPNENSKDFRVTWVVISEEFFKTISSQQFFNNRFRYESSPCFHLTDSQYADIMSIINAVKTLDRSEHRLRKMLMCNILDVLMEMTDDFRDQNEPESKTTTPPGLAIDCMKRLRKISENTTMLTFTRPFSASLQSISVHLSKRRQDSPPVIGFGNMSRFRQSRPCVRIFTPLFRKSATVSVLPRRQTFAGISKGKPASPLRNTVGVWRERDDFCVQGRHVLRVAVHAT